jgi:hypothetical protein
MVGVSMSFTAPGWNPSVARALPPTGQPVLADAFGTWLKSKGFPQQRGGYPKFTNGPIEIYVHTIDGEVAFATITFAPVDDAMSRLGGWHRLAEEMCQQWGFGLVDPERQVNVPVDQFLRILAKDQIWKVISKVNNWPGVGIETAHESEMIA